MQEIPTPIRVTALFCGTVREPWAENTLNIPVNAVAVVALTQLDLASLKSNDPVNVKVTILRTKRISSKQLTILTGLELPTPC